MPYYGIGSKATIMNNLYTTVLAIPGVVFVDVQRNFDTGISAEKYPGCFINDIVEDKEQIVGDIFRNTLSIGIVGWVRAADAEKVWDKQNAFAQSIMAALMVDPSRGSQAYDTNPTRLNTDTGTRHPVGLFILIIEIIYFGRV